MQKIVNRGRFKVKAIAYGEMGLSPGLPGNKTGEDACFKGGRDVRAPSPELLVFPPKGAKRRYAVFAENSTVDPISALNRTARR